MGQAIFDVSGYDFADLLPVWYMDQFEAPMHIEPDILKTVLFVGMFDETRELFTPMGTAFYTGVEVSGMAFQYAVTAKHVIDSFADQYIYLRKEKKAGGFGLHKTKKSDWITHPDPGRGKVVDVVACQIRQLVSEVDLLHIPLHVGCATAETIKEHNFTIGEDVCFAGLFTSHFGTAKNLPVLRTGTIAAMPEEPISTARGHMDAYLIEARSMGGISGSPIWIQLAPARTIANQIKFSSGIPHVQFLGMVSGHYLIESREDAVPEDGKQSLTGSMNTGLAVVVPVEKIIETIMQPKLVAEREAAVKSLIVKRGYVEDSAKPHSTESPSNPAGGDATLRQMLQTPPSPRPTAKAKTKAKKR